jgi:hypothetical protein
MPRLPDTSAFGARPTPQPNLGVVSIGAGDEAAMAAPGQQMVRSGQQMEATGDQIFHANKEFEAKAKIEQHKLDTVMAENAFNKLREHELELAQGDQGYSKVKGVDATSTPVLQTYSKRFADRAKELGDGLSNDDQRTMFNARAQVAGLGFREGVLRHLSQQGEVAAKQQWEATKVIEGKFINEYWAEPALVEGSLVRLDDGLKKRAAAEGWDPEYLKAMKQELHGKAYDTVIDQAVANGNLLYAKKIFDENKDSVDPKTAEGLAKKVIAAEQRQLVNGYNSAFLQVRDSVSGLKALEKAVTEDQRLDDASRNQQQEKYARRMELLNNKAQGDALRAEMRMARQARKFESLATSPYGLTDADRDEMGNIYMTNPEMRPRIEAAIQSDNALRGFRQMDDPAKQEAQLNAWINGAVAGKVDPRLVGRAQTMFEAAQRDRKENPLAYEIKRGTIGPDNLAVKPLLLGDPRSQKREDVPDPNQVQSRLEASRLAAARNNGPWKPLLPEEENLARVTLQGMAWKDRELWLSNTWSKVGDNKPGFLAIAKQASPDNPAFAWAANLAYGGRQDAEGKRVASTINQGLDIINPRRGEDGKPDKGTLIPQPSEKDQRTAFDRYVGTAYAGVPEARNAAFQAARAYYAAKASTNESLSKDTSRFDANLWEESLKMVTGGIYTYNDRQTVKPWGMSDSDFKDGVHARMRLLEKTNALPPGIDRSVLADRPLVPVPGSDTKYFVLKDNVTLLPSANGRPLMIDLSAPLPPDMKPLPLGTAKQREDATRARVQEARTAPVLPDNTDNGYGKRQDGTNKGKGYFGEIPLKGGGVATEYTVGINIDGKDRDVPTLVPTLTKKEYDQVLEAAGGKGKLSDAIVEKAAAYARKRIKDGKSPFAQPDEKFEAPK